MTAEKIRPRAVLSFLWVTHAQVLAELCTLAPDLTVISSVAAPGVSVVDFHDFVAKLAQEDATVTTQTKEQLASSYRRALLAQGMDEADFEQKFSNLIPLDQANEVLRLRRALDAVADAHDVAIVALSEDVTLQGKTIALWARQRGIPSVHVIHGIPLLGIYTVHREVNTDFVAVYGPRVLEAYADLGVSPDRLYTAGNPAWDIYPAMRSERARITEEVRTKYGLTEGTKTILFATTWAANLTAMCDAEIHIKSLLAILNAYRALVRTQVPVELVIKDRPANAQAGAALVEQVIDMLGMQDCRIVYAYEDGAALLAAADAVVAVDSNMLVEAMHLGVPAINLLNDVAIAMGTSFEEETGVLEVEAEQLAGALALVLGDADVAAHMAQRHLQRVSHYNVGAHDGGSARRVATLLRDKMKPAARPPGGFVWERYLAVEETPVVDSYHSGGRDPLVAMIGGSPRRALDVGCATGVNGALIKQRFPSCAVWGVETNRAAAAQASTRLDRVLVGRLDEFNLEKEGLPRGELDAVLFADVLEHMYDPWRALVEVRDYLSDDGDVIVSIPNVRNLVVVDGLLGRGAWRYEPEGILDVTHIRFFTKQEFVTAAHETGYRVDTIDRVIDGRLRQILNSVKSFPTEISGSNYVLKNLSQEDFADLCSVQFYFRLKKRRV